MSEVSPKGDEQSMTVQATVSREGSYDNSIWRNAIWMLPVVLLPGVNLLVFSGWYARSMQAAFSGSNASNIPVHLGRFLGTGMLIWATISGYAATITLGSLLIFPSLGSPFVQIAEGIKVFVDSEAPWHLLIATAEAIKVQWAANPSFELLKVWLLALDWAPRVSFVAALMLTFWFFSRMLVARFARTGSAWSLLDLRGCLLSLKRNPAEYLEPFVLNFLLAVGLAFTVLGLPIIFLLSSFPDTGSLEFLMRWGLLDVVSLIILGLTFQISAGLLIIRYILAVDIDTKYAARLHARSQDTHEPRL